MLKPVRLGLLVLAGLCLVPFQSAAQSASPIADTFSNFAKGTTNYGTNPIMMVQPGYTSYVQFSLSTLPAGAVVQKATLRLFMDSVTGKGQIDVYEARSAWNEMLLNYNNAPLLGASATGVHLECPANFVPVEMRQTGMRGAWNVTREEAYSGADREPASAG